MDTKQIDQILDHLHALNNLATVVSGYAQLLKSKMYDEQSTRYIENINKTIDRFAPIANNIADHLRTIKIANDLRSKAEI